MGQKQGLKNFALNIQPAIHKLRDRAKLSEGEQESIVQFYLEVVNYLAQPDSQTYQARQCPECGYKSHIAWRVKTQDYLCRRCAHIWKKE